MDPINFSGQPSEKFLLTICLPSTAGREQKLSRVPKSAIL